MQHLTVLCWHEAEHNIQNKKILNRIVVAVMSNHVSSYLFSEYSFKYPFRGRGERVSKQKNKPFTLMGLWSKGGSWPLHKNLFIYHCDTIRHGHPSEKMAERLSSALMLALSLCCLFQEKICTGSVSFFFYPIFFILGVRTSYFLYGHRGKGQKDTKRTKRKVTKVSSNTLREVKNIHIHRDLNDLMSFLPKGNNVRYYLEV